jgi:hypothetical protein
MVIIGTGGRMRIVWVLAFVAGTVWRISTASAFEMRSGSWGYEDTEYVDWFIKSDGQPITLTGQRFKFSGQIKDYWIDVNRCPNHTEAPCLPNSIHVNWYTGTGTGRDHRGVGAIGTAMFKGKMYRVDGVGTRLQFYTYGSLRLPKLGKDGQRKIRTLVTPVNGSFEHDGIFTPISGSVLVTVVFENYHGKMIPETISYDLVPARGGHD